ncbi:gustatory receptor for sugar taste 64f-like [Leguminivora glycinivorella]|uniref:gustatory receptor for sugar taste 64f-like n=1 Tax=Leguminivora glycinivorella TaxID=1035111 RepID=UPI00200C4130|nr:gustatory receptor for sugar taste 64f-like [Leguminivora glycinivorella]
MPYIYDHVTYTRWKAILLEIANFQATFLWNFTDIFIMAFSIYLTSYCNALYDHINKYIKEGKESGSWSNLRNRYCHLMALVEIVDSKISRFVLLAFFIDIFFICLQLFNTLKALNGVAHSVYYSFSFLFLILRAMLMSLLAAEVHAAARKPVIVLRNVQSSVYNVEIQRMLHQMTYRKLALSGFFFYITRNMILKVAAAIVTYELVLLQFGKGNGKRSSKLDDGVVENSKDF